VSMGAVVGATYALNPDWYAALRALDVSGLPGITTAGNGRPRVRLRAPLASERAVRSLLLRQGAWAEAQASVEQLLDELVLGRSLEECRLPFAAVASDLLSGRRVVLRRGKASVAMYASAALAGVLPPLRLGDALLADGGYADMAPVDVVRDLGAEVVMVVDASPRDHAPPPRNGFQVLLRAMAVSHQQHALRRYEQADLVIEPRFGFAIDTLDFRHQRHCIAAGAHAVRSQRGSIAALVGVRRGHGVAPAPRRPAPVPRAVAEGGAAP
jgi:NTE family protein